MTVYKQNREFLALTLAALTITGACTFHPALAETNPPVSNQQSCAPQMHSDATPEELKAAAHQCMVKQDWDASIGLYTKLLRQPDAGFHKEALEMLGLARERNGQWLKAKAEYEKYLATYPEGDDTERVKRRLDGLTNQSMNPREKLRAPRAEDDKFRWDTWGSVGAYYYRDALLDDKSGEDDVQSLALTTLDVTSKMHNSRYDVRAQLNARYRNNLEQETHNQNDQLRVANAYVDVIDRQSGWSGRLGRQSRSSGGAMGRFDGGVLSYRIDPHWQVTGIGGFPVRAYRSTEPNTDTGFGGISVQWGPFDQYWAGNIFFIEQLHRLKTDRRAIGGEVRYQHPKHPVFTLVDYDTYFGKFNTAQAMANWNFDDGSVLAVTADYRKTPYLSTSNALIGWGSGMGPGTGACSNSNSISEILFCQPNIDLKSVANNNTPTLITGSVNGITPLTEKLQFNADVSISNLSATKGSIWVSPYQSSGLQMSYMAQLIATRLFADHDVWNLGVRYSTQQTSNVLSTFADGRFPLSQDTRLDPRIRVDYFNGYKGTDTWRIRPGLRLNHQVVKSLFLELEGGFEYSTLPQVQANTDSKSYYLSIGGHWDF